jgi:choline dehydrogenase
MFRTAMVATGVPENVDYNGAQQEGVAFNQVTMHAGRRVSAASAYLAPVRHRSNLEVLTHALARRMVFDDRRAIGVEVDRFGRREIVRARREVLLCAGTIASPQLLMLSGIGPADALHALDIPVVADSPNVGRNLQEHVRASVVVRTRVPTFNQEGRGIALLRHVVRYATRRRGLLTATASQVNAFVRSSRDSVRPDITVVFRPASGDYVGARFVPHVFAGVMAMVGVMRPRSTGSVSLASPDPAAPPVIVSGHLLDSADADTLLRGVRLVRRVFATPPLRDAVDAEVQPGASVEDDDALREYLRATANSLFHATGTCSMGIDAGAVVTPQLEVRGVNGLRVVDASIMPSVPSGNTCAPVMMVAEKAADLVLGHRTT